MSRNKDQRDLQALQDFLNISSSTAVGEDVLHRFQSDLSPIEGEQPLLNPLDKQLSNLQISQETCSSGYYSGFQVSKVSYENVPDRSNFGNSDFCAGNSGRNYNGHIKLLQQEQRLNKTIPTQELSNLQISEETCSSGYYSGFHVSKVSYENVPVWSNFGNSNFCAANSGRNYNCNIKLLQQEQRLNNTIPTQELSNGPFSGNSSSGYFSGYFTFQNKVQIPEKEDVFSTASDSVYLTETSRKLNQSQSDSNVERKITQGNFIKKITYHRNPIETITKTVTGSTVPRYNPKFVKPENKQLKTNRQSGNLWQPAHIQKIDDICMFCRNNKEPIQNCLHPLKDANGLVACPVLFKHKCELCGETGALAHTRRHCPVLTRRTNCRTQIMKNK